MAIGMEPEWRVRSLTLMDGARQQALSSAAGPKTRPRKTGAPTILMREKAGANWSKAALTSAATAEERGAQRGQHALGQLEIESRDGGGNLHVFFADMASASSCLTSQPS
eukprot:6961529-Pyramimonas_sp.AAC.1